MFQDPLRHNHSLSLELGWTALHFAASGGSSEVTKCLLEAEVQLLSTTDGDTAIDFAREEMNVDILELLQRYERAKRE